MVRRKEEKEIIYHKDDTLDLECCRWKEARTEEVSYGETEHLSTEMMYEGGKGRKDGEACCFTLEIMRGGV